MPLINFSGIASGIDSEALIDAITEATRRVRVEPNEDKISELTDANEALRELKSKFSALQSLIRGFSTINGGGVKKEATSNDETVATASASNSASSGVYTITMSQLAKNGTASIDSSTLTYASGSDALAPGINMGAAAADRELVVDVGTGADLVRTTVVIDNTTTLNQVIDSLNTSFQANGNVATASLVNAGTASAPDYKILIVSNNTGTNKGTITITPDAEVTTANVASTVDQATNAQFTIGGISGTITRQSNTVSDLIPGVTFQLFAAGGTATITVGTDVAGTISGIQEYVDAYNDIVNFIKENNLIEREEDGENVTNIFAALAKTNVDDSSLTSLRSAMSGSSVSGTAVAIFPDFGVTTERDGTLKFNTQVAEEALGSNADSVRDILMEFADTAALTGGTIDQFIRFNGLFDVTINANETQISNLNDRIARAEAYIGREEERLRARFARLEGLIGGLQAQQQNLVAILAGLS